MAFKVIKLEVARKFSGLFLASLGLDPFEDWIKVYSKIPNVRRALQR